MAKIEIEALLARGVVVGPNHPPDLNRRQWLRALAALGLGVTPLPALARTGVHRVRMSVDGETTRLVFDMDGAADYSMFRLPSPERLVVDLEDARALEDLAVTQRPMRAGSTSARPAR